MAKRYAMRVVIGFLVCAAPLYSMQEQGDVIGSKQAIFSVHKRLFSKMDSAIYKDKGDVHDQKGELVVYNGEPVSNGFSLFNGHSASNGHGISNGHTVSNGYGHSVSNGYSASNGHIVSNGYGHSASNGHGISNGHTVSNGYGHSVSNGYSASNGHTISNGHSVFNEHSVSNEHSISSGHNVSNGHVNANGYSVSNGHSDFVESTYSMCCSDSNVPEKNRGVGERVEEQQAAVASDVVLGDKVKELYNESVKEGECECSDEEAVDIERQNQEEWFCAVATCNVKAMKSLLDRGFDSNTQLSGRSAALLVAAHTGNNDMIEMLIRYARGIDFNRENNRKDSTPLITAIVRGHEKSVRLLIEAEADVNYKTSFLGNTALYAAVKAGSPELVRLLLKAGASVDIEQPGYGTVLAYAQRVYDYAVSAKEMNAFFKIIGLLKKYAGVSRS